MKLVQFFNEAQSLGADRRDPLLSIVVNLMAEETNLKNLKGKTKDFLVPGPKSKGFMPVFDPDASSEVEALAASIEDSKTKIGDTLEKINKVDAILHKYQIERPLLKEIRVGIGSGKKSIEDAKTKAAGVLGHVLSFKVQDEEQARKHPQYLQALRELDARRSAEPHIKKLEECLAELQAVL